MNPDFPTHLQNVWIYLRKSREDSESEERARKEGRTQIETLSRHRRTLLDLANTHCHTVTRILEEVASGEFISERPEMMKLLSGVEHEEVSAIWVMDLDRLGRGDMADQGTILRTFKDSGTLILTPDKVYDLRDEMDEEWTEFKTFFARRELKMITKRMQRGRMAAVREGKFIGTRPPYGYDITKELVLVPNKDAKVVRQIFNLYVNHSYGCNRIAQYLNSLGIETPTGRTWRGESILALLKNAVYSGWIEWRKVKRDKRRKTYRLRPKAEWIRAKGLHEPIVDEATFTLATKIRIERAHTPIAKSHSPSNPLAGLILCGKCGEMLVKRTYTKQAPHLICKNPNCSQKSTRLSIVEDRLVMALSVWFENYELHKEELSESICLNQQDLTGNNAMLQRIDEKINVIQFQQNSLHDLLERGVYDELTYLQRVKVLKDSLEASISQRSTIQSEMNEAKETGATEQCKGMAISNILSAYRMTKNIAKQNALLKSILHKAIYNKEKWQQRDELDLVLFPHL